MKLLRVKSMGEFLEFSKNLTYETLFCYIFFEITHKINNKTAISKFYLKDLLVKCEVFLSVNVSWDWLPLWDSNSKKIL